MTDSPSTCNGSHSAQDEPFDDLPGEASNYEAAISSPKKRGPSQGIGDHEVGQPRMVIVTNYLLQPEGPDEFIKAFSTKLGIIARRDIPICYTDWRNKDLKPFIEEAVNVIEKQFKYDYQESLDTKYTRTKLNDAWRNFKHYLYENHVKDKDPSVVMLETPEGITMPLEEWQAFVDICNSEKFQATSARNMVNRKKQKLPSCSGRTLASVIRRRIAVERGIPVSQVGRAKSYKAIHTRKNKTPQCVELTESIDNYISTHPESQPTSTNDAITNTVGGDGKGRFRGMGTGVSKTQIEMMEPVLKKNAALEEKNSELEKKVANMEVKMDANMVKIRTLFATQRYFPPDVSSPSSHATGHSATMDSINIGKECDMRGGCRWPLQVVARGIVQDVDPSTDFGDRKLEEGNFKVYVNVVHDLSVQLPCPHDEYFTTLGQIGQGSVIWPKELLVFHSSSTCS